MTDSKSVVTLKSIVANVMNDMGPDANMENYLRYLQFTIRGVKELSLFHLNIVRTVQLDMSDINTVTLPTDFLTFIGCGVPYQGRLWTFTQDKLMIIPMGEDCGDDSLDTDYGEGTDITSGYSFDGYGVPGGANSTYFKLDLENNRIILSGFSRTTVTLKYVSTGVSLDGETMIPKIAEESLIAWVHWKRQQYDRKSSRTDKEAARRDYLDAVTLLRDLQSPTIDELYDAIYETFYQSAKR